MVSPNIQTWITLLALLFLSGSYANNITYNYWPKPFDEQLALRIISKGDESNYGAAIPGGSPFFYMEYPRNDLFSIFRIDVTPNPCQM